MAGEVEVCAKCHSRDKLEPEWVKRGTSDPKGRKPAKGETGESQKIRLVNFLLYLKSIAGLCLPLGYF